MGTIINKLGSLADYIHSNPTQVHERNGDDDHPQWDLISSALGMTKHLGDLAKIL